MKLLFATHNQHKIQEVRSIIGNLMYIVNLKEIFCVDEIPETGNTLEENALQKARYVYDHYKMNCFADDTGLEVDALNGLPGVFSARYAGEKVSFRENIEKLLKNLENKSNRKARFRTVVALILDGKEYLFEGKVEGEIISEQRGIEGFGYDPIFQPESYQRTFAELTEDEKNRISHRGRVIRQMMSFLKEQLYIL